MKSYLEIYVPIQFDEPWFVELRNALTGVPVRWQTGYYHITMAFLNETPANTEETSYSIPSSCLDIR